MSTSSPSTDSTLISRRDITFLLYEWLGVEAMTERPQYAGQSRDVYDEVIDLSQRIAADLFVPHNREADENEPHIGPDGKVHLVDGVGPALDAFFEAGLAGAAMPESVGGMNLPSVIGNAGFSYFHAANTASAVYAMLTIGAANLIVANGSEEQIERYASPMVEGRFYGTMCLSETQAGSSLTDITTRAEPQADGTYRIFGSKMWISGGEHELAENIVHLVLAKIPGGPAGVKGISLFIVPRVFVNDDGSLGEQNDVALAGLNHKMGFRGTVNTVMAFGDGEHTPGGEAGAVGWLVGEEHRGLAYMFHMMNEARTGVGLGATSLGYAGYLKSLKYSKERLQGRPVTGKDPAAAQLPIIEHPDVRRMLLAQKSYVEGALALSLYCAKLDDDHRTLEDEEGRNKAGLLLDLLTPITKSWPSQWCLEANSLAIQILGGYGYARDYEVEQHYRDNRLNPIHEGTHGIQALDLLGRKVVMQGGAALGALVAEVASSVERAKAVGGDTAEHAVTLEATFQRLLEVTGALWGNGAEGAEQALANATAYLEAAGDIVVAWLWLEQLLAADGKDGEFYDGKRAAARYFFRVALPRTGPQLDLLASGDRTTLDLDPAVL
ncbi:MAG: acyl-CoA dehydrogenase [Actinomycetes bacterium]